MDQAIKRKIEYAVGSSVLAHSPLSGGDIASAYKVTTSDKRVFFCKTAFDQRNMFVKEANGLKELAKSGAVYVPEVFHAEDGLLILEMIKGGQKSKSFFQSFGQAFARMHRYTGDSYGFYEDNYIGSTYQKNSPKASSHLSWAAFYFEYRILYQTHLLEEKGYSTKELSSLVARLESRIEDLLATDDESASLLHGDLWGGNYIVGEGEASYLIDPAVYYGHREADLAMTTLFGGFDSTFYISYNEEYPLEPGFKEREPLYHLYHLMNHLNLFGGGYYSQVLSILKKFR